jgi:hypothetical protein
MNMTYYVSIFLPYRTNNTIVTHCEYNYAIHTVSSLTSRYVFCQHDGFSFLDYRRYLRFKKIKTIIASPNTDFEDKTSRETEGYSPMKSHQPDLIRWYCCNRCKSAFHKTSPSFTQFYSYPIRLISILDGIYASWRSIDVLS